MDNIQDIKELVEKAKGYDAEAFGKLYDLYFDKVFGFAYYKVGNRFEAEDIAEQVFLKALENIAGFEWRGTPFSAWLFRIASNLIIDHYRSNKHRAVDLDENLDIELDASHGPEEFVFRELDRREVARAIGTLTEEQQQVVVMRFIFGMTNEEVAKAIDKNVGAIKALQHRAIGALARALGEIYDETRHR
jgi:RNA polymerase sigma-70 factor (ECF subfamily)